MSDIIYTVSRIKPYLVLTDTISCVRYRQCHLSHVNDIYNIQCKYYKSNLDSRRYYRGSYTSVTVVSTSAIIEIDNTAIGTIVGHIHQNCCECYYRNRYY